MKKFKWVLAHIPDILAGIACTLIIVLVFVNVVNRAFFNKSLVWVEEFSALCFTWSIFLGAACCFKRRGGLVSIDSFVKLFPGISGRVLTLLVDLVQVVLCGLFTYWGYQFAVTSSGKHSLILRLPYTYYNIAIPIAFLIMLGIAVRNCVQDVKALRGGDGETAVSEKEAER